MRVTILFQDLFSDPNDTLRIRFLKQIKRYSGKKIYYRNKLRKDYVLEQGKKDYISSKMFRAEMSKFLRAFLELFTVITSTEGGEATVTIAGQSDSDSYSESE